MRRLLVTYRTVPLDRSEEYTAGWQRLAAATVLRTGRAWLFRRAGHEDRFVEFLEWQEPAPLLEDADIAEARRVLAEIATGAEDELEEAT